MKQARVKDILLEYKKGGIPLVKNLLTDNSFMNKNYT